MQIRIVLYIVVANPAAFSPMTTAS